MLNEEGMAQVAKRVVKQVLALQPGETVSMPKEPM